MSENDVIARIKSGDDNLLSAIYTDHRQEFTAWLMKNYSCTVDEAKEVYQLSIVIFYENILSGRLTHMTSTIKSYLFAIGKNKMLEYKKYGNRFVNDVDGNLGTQMEDESKTEKQEKEITFTIVEECLHLLGDPCQSLLDLYYYHKKTMTEIAEQLGYKNTDTAKNQKYKCMKRLKKLFEERNLNTA